MKKLLLLGLLLTFPPMIAGWGDVAKSQDVKNDATETSVVVTSISVENFTKEKINRMKCDISGCKERVAHILITQDVVIAKRLCEKHKDID